MSDKPCDTVNFEAIRSLLNERFKQQKNELTQDLIADLAQVNQEHYAEVERQISSIKRNIVGWGWFIVGLVSVIILSISISFILLTWYHEKYLTENRYIRELHEAQSRDRGTTRAILVKKMTDAQIDSLENEILKSLKK